MIHPRISESNDGFKGRPPKIQRGWKPVSLSPVILSAFISLSLLLAAAIEALAQRSQDRGALALSPSRDEIPQYAMISYLYGPTIVAVLYSLIWHWIDMDAKRMQPWFLMSSENGAAAKDSAFLDYPSEFVALVPYSSARRRHWLAFASGITMVVIYWLLTPIQSALLGTVVIHTTESVDIKSRLALPPLSEQAQYMNYGVWRSIHSIEWYTQQYPYFSTSEYALLPFYAERNVGASYSERNWTATTSKIWAELSCSSLTTKMNGATKSNDTIYDFSTDDECTESRNIPISYRFGINYGDSQCSKSSHGLLLYWYAMTANYTVATDKSHINPAAYKVTAYLCEPSFYKQDVLATVNKDFRPVEGTMQSVSNQVELTDKDLNITAFLHLFKGDIETSQEPWSKLDYPIGGSFQYTPSLSILEEPTIFAISSAKTQSAAFSYPENLGKIFDTLFRQQFAIAIGDGVVSSTSWTNNTGTLATYQTGIAVSRALSAASEALLILVACSTAFILWYCYSSPCKLRSNPSSIGRMLDLAHNSPDVRRSFQSVDTADEKSLISSFGESRFKVCVDDSRQETVMTIDGAYEDLTPVQKSYYEPVRPHILRRGIGMSFTVSLVVVLIVLCYLKGMEQKHDGLTRPSKNFEVLQLLENYVPTIIATLTEPFWVLLTRTVCVFQPFKELHTGHAKAQTSIDAPYASIPPQLVIFRALKSRHFLISLLCVVSLLANVLAVAMGALFNEAPVQISHVQRYQTEIRSRFNNSIIQQLLDPSYDTFHDGTFAPVIMANMTANMTLPPWVSTEYYFQPYTIVSNNQTNSTVGNNQTNSTDTFSVRTRGFGMKPNCSPVNTSSFLIPTPWNVSSHSTGKRSSTCADPVEKAKSLFGDVLSTMPSDGTAAITLSNYPSSSLDSNQSDSCELSYIWGWGRVASGKEIVAAIEESYPNKTLNASMEASFSKCVLGFETAMFDVTVDSEGYVLDYRRTSTLTSSLGYSESQNHTDTLIKFMGTVILTAFRPSWTANDAAGDWWSYLLLLETGSRRFLEPNSSIPEPEGLIPSIENLYRRLFAAYMGNLGDGIFDTANEEILGKRFTGDTHIFMDKVAFVLSLVVLVINLIVAIIFYSRSAYFFLPRVPSTIGSILAYIAPSRAVGKGREGFESKTFSFGRYIGEDGKSHVGIELDPHVVAADSSLLGAKQPLLNRMIRREDTNKF